MKNIRLYEAQKYKKTIGFFRKKVYQKAEEGIYQKAGVPEEEKEFFISLSFEQEPELDEGENAGDISQFPLEDILEKFSCYVNDFYDDLNQATSNTCYLEFASPDLSDLQNLKTIIGKHVYNVPFTGEDGREYVDLKIE